MKKKQKPLKPGQLVTSNNHIYRVTKVCKGLPCPLCDFTCTELVSFTIVHLCDRIPSNCYFKLVK